MCHNSPQDCRQVVGNLDEITTGCLPASVTACDLIETGVIGKEPSVLAALVPRPLADDRVLTLRIVSKCKVTTRTCTYMRTTFAHAMQSPRRTERGRVSRKQPACHKGKDRNGKTQGQRCPLALR